MTKKATGSKVHNLVDPALKKQFIEMRDHWKGLDDRANSAAGKRRQYQKEIKTAGFGMQQIKDSLRLMTPEGEADFKAEIANRLLAAAYSDADIGDQLSLFLDSPRVPAVDRAYKEGQTACMEGKPMVPKYAPETEQYRAYVEGFHAEQERQIKGGIGKLDAKADKGAKNGPDKPKGKRGRPAKAASEEPANPTAARLITKAEKDAKAAARAAKPSAPPRKPAAEPVTRATVAATRAKAKEEADAFFTKSKPVGNA